MKSQGIETHILHKPPYIPSEDNKINEAYVSYKKDNSLTKSWIWGTLTEEVLYFVSGFLTANNVEGPWRGFHIRYKRYRMISHNQTTHM